MRKLLVLLAVAVLLSQQATLAQYNNTAPGKLGDVLPNAGVTFGVDLQKEVRNGTVLPVANGGTGQSSFPLSVSNGGTGLSALTAHYLIVGNGTSAATLLAPSSTAGVPLVSAGSSANPAYGTTVVAGGGTGLATLTANSLLAGNGTSAVNLIAPGTAQNRLVSNGTAWVSTAPDAAATTLAMGTVSVTDANVTASSIIIACYKGSVAATNPGHLSVTPGSGSFTIDSDSATDSSDVMYYVVKY